MRNNASVVTRTIVRHKSSVKTLTAPENSGDRKIWSSERDNPREMHNSAATTNTTEHMELIYEAYSVFRKCFELLLRFALSALP